MTTKQKGDWRLLPQLVTFNVLGLKSLPQPTPDYTSHALSHFTSMISLLESQLYQCVDGLYMQISSLVSRMEQLTLQLPSARNATRSQGERRSRTKRKGKRLPTFADEDSGEQSLLDGFEDVRTPRKARVQTPPTSPQLKKETESRGDSCNMDPEYFSDLHKQIRILKDLVQKSHQHEALHPTESQVQIEMETSNLRLKNNWLQSELQRCRATIEGFYEELNTIKTEMLKKALPCQYCGLKKLVRKWAKGQRHRSK